MTTVVVPAMYAGTPALTALGVRGSTVRELQCYREAADDDVDLRITRHSHGPRGQLIQSLDPRLASTSPNFRWQHDLGGQLLRTDSVDAGVTLALTDIAGRALLAVSATGLRQTSTYEDSTLPGRLQAVLEQAPGEVTAQVTDRYCWAGQSSAEKGLNLSGECVRHYDTAGLSQLRRASVNGAVLAQSRQLLAGEQAADWAGDSEQGWQAALDAEAFVTQRTVDATGAQLTQTDACGHAQRQAYHLTGQLRGSWLTLQGQAEQVIVASLRYSAMGQKEQEVHGNGVVTDYDYAPRTQHLVGIRVQRPANARSAARVLQDLRYTYDPVGNVLNVRNDAEATRFWRNQKVVPEQRFTYDSLYQLVQATGREMANRGQQDSQLPAVVIPIPTHDDAYTPYTRTYRYDRAGNLTHIRHSAPASHNNYTTELTVSNRSNRAVLAQDGLLPEDVDEQFDDGGHQLALLPGQHLRWNTRGELAQVTPILREGQPDDREWYRYGSDAMRVLKVSQQQAAGTTHVQRVLYLEGLEVRSTRISDITSERLQVIAVAAGGGAEIRVLRWTSGLPPELKNDQIRYSYHDLIGSSGVELDAQGEVISQEEYYPYGGTAMWTARNQVEANYKTIRYSSKERDATGLYYYGYRYYQPWACRWLSSDLAGTVDGLNLYRMVRNNPLTMHDPKGMDSKRAGVLYVPFAAGDILYQIAGYNLTRLRTGKDPLTVMVANREMMNQLQTLRDEEVERADKRIAAMSLRVSHELQRTGLTVEQLKVLHGEGFEKLVASLDFASRRTDVLRKMTVSYAMNELDPAKSKLYILGHGLAGVDFLAADTAAVHSASAFDIAKQFSDGGLPKSFEDVRVNACFSGDAITPRSQHDKDADRPTEKLAFINWLDRAMEKEGFNEKNGNGEKKLTVWGYRFEGKMFSDDKHHSRIINGQTLRRSRARVK